MDKIKELTGKQKAMGAAACCCVIVCAAAIGVAAGGSFGDAAVAQDPDVLLAAANEPVQCWSYSVNGEEIAYLATEEDARAVFDGVTAHYTDGGATVESVSYGELVEFAQCELPEGKEISSVQDAVTLVLTGSVEPKVYTVQSGDTMWDIAAANGLSVYELADMNPTITPERLSIGQQLNLYELHPYMTVSVTELVSSTERIPYDTIYEATDTLYKGQTSVKTAGEYGSKNVQTRLTKTNGYLVASEVVSETVTLEPVTQVALQGTMTVPVSTGGGNVTLSAPMAHMELSSPYGA